MNEFEKSRMVDQYLNSLSKELGGLPEDVKRELLEDIRGHIEVAWEGAAVKDQAALLNILERLGSPRALASEQRERLGMPATLPKRGPDVLSVLAVIFTVIFWPIGVLLSWLSDRWLTRDKVVVTLIPIIGLLVGLVLNVYAIQSFTSSAVVTVSSQTIVDEAGQPVSSGDGSVPIREVRWQEPLSAIAARVIVFYAFLGAPLSAAIYLVGTLGSSRRWWVVLAPAVVAIVLVAALFVLFLTPASMSVSQTSGSAPVVIERSVSDGQ